MLGQLEENNLYENTTTPLLIVRMNCLTKREDFCLNDRNRNSMNQKRRKQTDLAVLLIYWQRNFMKFDVEHPNWRLPYLQDASPLPSSNIPSIRWYKAPNNVNLEGGRPGKGRRFGLEAFFFRANALPLQLRLEVKCVSLKVATYQHLEKTSSALKCCLYIKRLTSFVNLLLLECNRM